VANTDKCIVQVEMNLPYMLVKVTIHVEESEDMQT
jgi:hypothetical protein